MHTSFDVDVVLARAYSDVRQRFAPCHDLAHGWDHVRRVYDLALHLARQEGGDHFIVGVAALMHDLGRTVEQEQEHHADISFRLACELLVSYKVPSNVQQAIGHAILAHSFSRGIEPYTLEARIVRDADRLDALGAVGIMRWGIVGAQLKRPGLQPYHPDDPFVEHHTPDDQSYMLDHFYSKLFKLVDTMNTETARSIAEHRTALMRLYLDEFRRELELR